MRGHEPAGKAVPVDPTLRTLANLHRACELWQPARDAAERAGGMSAALNHMRDTRMEAIDQLLDELNGIGRVAVEGAVQ